MWRNSCHFSSWYQNSYRERPVFIEKLKRSFIKFTGEKESPQALCVERYSDFMLRKGEWGARGLTEAARGWSREKEGWKKAFEGKHNPPARFQRSSVWCRLHSSL